MPPTPPAGAISRAFGPVGSALAVVAHPDDETFALGAVLADLAAAGARVSVLCFTHGESTTLGVRAGERRGTAMRRLAEVRALELRRAADELGLDEVSLLDFPDGELDRAPAELLAAEVEARAAGVEVLVVMEPSGVTGHPDHRAATAAAAAVAERLGIGILQWGISDAVAARLNSELCTSFSGFGAGPPPTLVVLSRSAQRRAIACHQSQAAGNSVLERRLELQGADELLRWEAPRARS